MVFFPGVIVNFACDFSWFLEKIIQENMIQFVESNSNNKITDLPKFAP